jgi:glycosyltransferase involved in cell wall biosynthesis
MGGAEQVVKLLSTRVNRSRFELIPCALYRSGPVAEELESAAVRCRVLKLRRRSVLSGPLFVSDVRRILASLRALVAELSIDVIHAHLTESVLLAILTARSFANVKVCATIHNITLNESAGWWDPRQWFSEAVLPKLFPKADRIIAVSEQVASTTARRLRIPQDRILTIPNGVDGAQFRTSVEKRTLRRKLGLPADRKILISVGRLSRQKGYPFLLSALARLPAEQRPLTLVLGDGPDLASLRALASRMGLASDVEFLGNRTNTAEFLNASDIFVMSALWEGLPLALLEAMASGLPIVVTRVGGNLEAIEDGRSGILVPPTDDSALSGALRRLLESPAERMRMGQAARERFDEHFSVRPFIEAHERLYSGLFLSQT